MYVCICILYLSETDIRKKFALLQNVTMFTTRKNYLHFLLCNYCPISTKNKVMYVFHKRI